MRSMVTVRCETGLDQRAKANALARFGRLRGRSVHLRFEHVGPVVEASSPDELEVATAAALARLVEGQVPS